MIDEDDLTVRAPEQSDVQMAVLFADLSGSTRMYELLGDAEAKFIITDSLGKLTEVVKEFDGRVVKTIGDELMCIFRTAHEAVMAGRQMIKAAADLEVPQTPKAAGLLHLRVGAHYGPVIEERNDIFGDTVNVAARLVSLAKSNSFMASGAIAKALPEAFRHMVSFYDTVVMRGKARPVDVYEILTGAAKTDETSSFPKTAEVTHGPLARAKLRLKVRDSNQTLEVSKQKPTVSIGRGRNNDVVMDHHMVSREHARIDYKHGKFYVSDFSSNGTYIELQGGTRTLLKKSDCNLVMNGVIYFGEEPSRKAKTALEFVLS
jgi:class 3 adenylate cyclase